MANDALINLTASDFTELMRTEGLENTVRGVLQIANEEIDTAGEPLTLESLKQGTHPLLDKLDRYSGLEPKNRQISEEEILTLFTNVEDFGKYDPNDDTSPGSAAFKQGFLRAVPEAVGAGVGAKVGLATGAKIGTKIASFIPPLGPVGLLAKGAAIGLGGLTGLVLGAFAAGRAEDAIIGEETPVVPSLRRQRAAGETFATFTTLPASVLVKAPLKKAQTGAVEFVEQFKNVAGKKIDKETFTTYAKNAGLKPKQADDLYEKAMRTREARSQGGQMFGGEYGINLGFTRFNPSGRLLDPTKGPAVARTIAGIEKGIETSVAAARANPGKFLAAELLPASGASASNLVTDPYNPTERLVGEVAGSFFPPVIVSATVGAAKTFGPGVWNKITGWYGNKDNVSGLLTGKIEESAVNDILTAIRRSEEYADTVSKTTNVETTAEEKLGFFIDELLLAGAKNADEVEDFNRRFAQDIADEKVEARKPYTAADLAEANNLPFSKTLRTIQNELEKTSKDMALATGRGREQLKAGSNFAIRSLSSTGDPEALNAAARLTQANFEQNIIDNIEGAVNKLNESATRVLGRSPDGGSGQVDLSKDLYNVLQNQISIGKARERELWNEVGDYKLTEFFAKNGRKIDEPNILRILDRPAKQGGLLFASKGRQADFNKALGPYLDDIKDLREYFQNNQGTNPASAQRFFEIRSGLLDKAAERQKAGNKTDAMALNKLADAVFQDLTGVRNDVTSSYNVARAYTFARNNVFTRSFLSDLQSTDKNRGLILSPEQLLDQAFKGTYSAANERIAALQNASKFLIDEGVLTEAEVLSMGTDDLLAAGVRDFMRKVVDTKRVKDPLTGDIIETFVVNPTKFATQSKNPGFEEFIKTAPGLAEDLADADAAQKTFNNMLGDVTTTLNPNRAKELYKYSDEQIENLYGVKAFQTILANDNPASAVAQALSSEKPIKAMNALFRLVDEADMTNTGFTKGQALEGFKQAIFSHAVREAQKRDTTQLDGNILQKILFEQVENAPPDQSFNLIDFLKDKKLIEAADAENIEGHIKNIKGVEEAFATGDFEGVLFKNPSLSKLFATRIVGATAGSAFQMQLKRVLGLPQLSGGLIAEQTGSELVQKLFLQAPEAQRNKIIVNLFSNPQAMSGLMKTIKTKKDLKDASRVLEKIVRPLVEQTAKRIPPPLRATVETLKEEEPIEVEEPVGEEETPPQASLPPVPQFMDRDTRLQGAETTPTMSSAPVAPAPVPTGPVNRSQYAALFPSDIASGLIRSQDQGIGSLMS